MSARQNDILVKSKSISTFAYGIPTLYGVFQRMKDQCCELWDHWGDNTYKEYDEHMRKRIVPNLADHNISPVSKYVLSDFAQLRVKLEKSERKKETVDKYMHIVKTVMTVAAINGLCLDLYRELEEESGNGKIDATKQYAVPPRSLSPEQEILLNQYLQDNLFHSGEVTGLWLMYLFGLRNGEACGADFGDIRELEQHPGNYELLLPESVVSGTSDLQLGGKSYNTGRRLYLPTGVYQTLMELRDARIKLLQSRNQEIPSKLPIACRKSDPAQRCGSTDLTKAARQLFLQIGMRKEELISLTHELWREHARAQNHMQEDSFALVEKEPTAYLLRRHFATLLHMLNLSESEKQYLMGHRIEDPDTVRTAYNDEAVRWPMYEKLKYRPLLEPERKEQVMQRFYCGTVRGTETIRIPAGAGRIDLDLKALEPDMPLNVLIECSTEVPVEYCIYSNEVSGSLKDQPIYIDDMIQKVYRIK